MQVQYTYHFQNQILVKSKSNLRQFIVTSCINNPLEHTGQVALIDFEGINHFVYYCIQAYKILAYMRSV